MSKIVNRAVKLQIPRQTNSTLPTPSLPLQYKSLTHSVSSSIYLYRTMTSSSAPAKDFEPRQSFESGDWTPSPAKSLPLSPQRQALVDDIIALYNCKPTIERVKRYSPDCIYDDQFGYADNRFKVAGQWFALPKLFQASENKGYEVTKNDPGLIQFKSEQ
ncbi:hypothetical protein Golomagni_03465, partial [Golovinomyces magnicellulatus]